MSDESQIQTKDGLLDDSGDALLSDSGESLLPAETQDLVPKTLKRPKDLPAGDLEKVEQMALSMSEKILKDPSDRSAVREATSVGQNVQMKANDDFKLLRTSLGKVMDRMQSGENKSIPGDLKKLRNIMDEINPYPAIEQIKRSQTAGFFSRLFRRVPGVGKVLADIAQKYESVQTQIDAITQSLEAGSDKLLENILEIEERYKNLKKMQKLLKLRGYQLQFLLKKLEAAQPKVTGDLERQTLQKAIAKIVRRLQNIKVTENAFAQFFITMNVTMDNHENLREAVHSMINLTRPVLENGLALKIAQQEERQIAEALNASQDYLGNLMVNIAEDAMDNAARTAEVTNQPLIKLQDLTKSYKILVSRMDEASQIEARMVDAAKQNISQLEQMSEDLEKRAGAQEAARDAVGQAGV